MATAEAMIETGPLGWAVLAKDSLNGRSEVIKVTNNYAAADEIVQNDPSRYYKSGPFIIS